MVHFQGGILNAIQGIVTADSSQIQGGVNTLLSQANSVIGNLGGSTTVTSMETTTMSASSASTSSESTFTTSTSASTFPSLSSLLASSTQESRPVLSSAAILPTLPSSTSSSTSSQTRDPWDRRLGIILGVVLGSIALGLCFFLVWFLHRRRKETGTFFQRRPSTPSDKEVYSWRGPTEAEKYGAADAPPLLQRPMASHGGYENRTWTSDDDDMNLGYRGYRADEYNGVAELSADHSDRGSLRRMATSEYRHEGPPTRFSPESFSAMAAGPVSPIELTPQRHGSNGFWPARASSDGYHNIDSSQAVHPTSLTGLSGYPHPYYQNPFASNEDFDEEPETSYHNHQRHPSATPDIPSRSPRRQSTPVVVYPSSDELGKFNFGTTGEGSRGQKWSDRDV
jgi:hypothetical protein